MASPVALAIESSRKNGSSDRAALGSSLQRSYGTVKEASSPALTSSGKLYSGGYTEHSVDEEDTLQGLALRYGVSIHHILRLNKLSDSESIQSRNKLKIPNTSLSPLNSRPAKSKRISSSLQDISIGIRDGGGGGGGGGGGDDEEEEVKRKPLARSRVGGVPYEPFREKTIESLLTAADERIVAMQLFNEKLELKVAHLRQPADAYNRPTRASLSPSLPHTSDLPSSSSATSSHHSSLEVVVERGDKRRRQQLAKEGSASLSNSRDTIEDNVFEL